MTQPIDAAMRATKTVQELIFEIKAKISRDDQRYELIDDAELGLKWVLGRLKDLGELPDNAESRGEREAKLADAASRTAASQTSVAGTESAFYPVGS